MNIHQFSGTTQKWIGWGGGACIAVMVAIFFLSGVFEIPELLTYDWRFQWRGERDPLEEILIITIDEESVKTLGQRLPWKRSIHAEMLRTLMQHAPELIVYDLAFTMPTEAAEDEAFANALYDAYDEARKLGRGVLAEYVAGQWEKPLPMFADNAGGIGVINITKDRDDIVRYVLPSVYEFLDDGTAHPHFSLGIEAALVQKGGANDMSFPEPDTLVLSRVREEQRDDVLQIIAPQGRMYINYIGGSHSYPMLSFAKILRGEYRSEEIEGKVIFIGNTTLTAHDYFLTPFRKPNLKLRDYYTNLVPNAQLPNVLSTFGIEIHAQAYQTVVEQSYIRKLNHWWSVFSILCVGTISGIVFFRDRGFLLNTLILLFTGGIVWGISQYLFSAQNLRIELAPLEILLVLDYVAGLGFHRAVAHYSRNQVKSIFQYYVSPAVVEALLKHPEKIRLGGERKFLTVLFSDIRGFTTISEGMESHELAEYLNEYLTAMTNIILKHDGTLDKYVGDAIMTIYGAPIDQEDHAARACATALDMMTTLRELQHAWRSQGRPVISIGIGINSGIMSVGNMGSETRFDFTVIGDHVNLGARLEGANKQYGTHIILSEYTYRELDNGIQTNPFIVRELDLVRVKGKKEPVKIYELVGRAGEVDSDTLKRIEHFHQGIAAYRDRQWNAALEEFKQALSLYLEDIPAQLYIQRCRAYRITPPSENWDGAYTMTTK